VPPTNPSPTTGSFGPNQWLVDDLYEQYLRDPSSVAPSWREFFVGFAKPAPFLPAAVPHPPSLTPSPTTQESDRDLTLLRGSKARLVANMTNSLSVPTATSVRTVSARLLEVNRSLLNKHLARSSGIKLSFTHLIAFAVVRALTASPAMNTVFVSDVDSKGTPGFSRAPHVGLGLAIDVIKPGGDRTLLVPVVKDADTLNFAQFFSAYEDLIRRSKSNNLTPDDFTGATVSLTNPGTLGTTQSVPRLMVGQGVIVGVGALTRPAGFESADLAVLASLGAGSVLNLTSTYDHRVIQGAESGLFLKYVAECLTGQHQFYEEVFRSLAVPFAPAVLTTDLAPAGDDQVLKQIRVTELINMYRVRGHLYANLDPLHSAPPLVHPELELASYGLTIWDLPRRFVVDDVAGRSSATLAEILDILRDAYCSTIGIEYGHVLDPVQKQWIRAHVEGVTPVLTAKERRGVVEALTEAEVFEKFLHSRYVGQKRFGLEGAEATIVALRTILEQAALSKVSSVVIGMAHRGRLNVMANIVGKSYHEIFSEFEGNLDPTSVQGSGDVKYHKGATGTYSTTSGDLRVILAANPSHLEAVSPVAEGLVRALQDQVIRPSDTQAPSTVEHYPYVAVLIHGDAAFAGQGVVAETLNMSQLSGYRIGGTVHVIINNQLGFTTDPASGHSSFYPTDVAKMIQAPIFHVNGDDPEAVAWAARLAYDYRETFHRDAVLDIVCYRRYGHNEGDDPSYTQPLMYKIIDSLRSVRFLYVEALIRCGLASLDEAQAILDSYQARLQEVLDEVRFIPAPTVTDVVVPSTPVDEPAPQTGVPANDLLNIANAISRVPENFTLHPKLVRQFASRDELLQSGEVEWTLAESLAIGSLVASHHNVRLVGQDTRRGTFSQRHAALIDYETGTQYIPLAHVAKDQGFFTVRDSFLSEYAAVGFEYGYSLASPNTLVMWEAQFGDFANGAQIILDNFLSAGQEKWDQRSGLVLLLPHGYEGQGPEHSSARLERFLSLAQRNNIRVTIPSTSAQYFHVLRSQLLRESPVPLVVLTPKSLLRSPRTRSPLEQLEQGSFQSVIADPVADPVTVTKVILASGKVAHEVVAERDKRQLSNTAVVRLEQLYPLPHVDLTAVLASYPNAHEIIWLQEEPANMGAWPYLRDALPPYLGEVPRLVARPPSSSPATGSALIHAAQQADLLVRALS
jgi:multifunctional 2-oxoglutarate metabolism enzyme